MLIDEDRQESCPKNYRRCNHNLCVHSEEECPLTKIEFLEDNITNNNTDVIITNGKKIIVKHRDFAKTPLYSLEVSFNGLPCYANDSLPYVDDAYILLDKNNGCGRFGQDTGSSIADEMYEIDFYIGNGITTTLEKLPTYLHTL